MVLGSWWCSLELWGGRPGRCSSEAELSDAALSGQHPGHVAKSPEVPPASASGRALSQRLQGEDRTGQYRSEHSGEDRA